MHSSPLSLPGDLLDLMLSVIERHLVEQGTEQQTLGLLKIVRQDIKSAGRPSLFYGDPNASILFVNDLTKMGLIKAANFGPALLSQGDKRKSRSNPPGSMVTFLIYIHPNSGRANSLFIAGKDNDGNYWLKGDLLATGVGNYRQRIEGYVMICFKDTRALYGSPFFYPSPFYPKMSIIQVAYTLLAKALNDR